MAFPKVMDGRVDQNLTNVLLAYTNPRYFAEQIFPTVGGLVNDTGDIPRFGKDHLRQYAAKRTLWDETQHRISFEVDTSEKYAIEYFDLSILLPDRLISQWKQPFEPRNAAQLTLIESLKLSRDAAIASLITDVAVITNNLNFTSTAARQYTATTSTPIKDIQQAQRSVFKKTGRKGNAITVQGEVADALRQHADFKAIATAYIQGGASKEVALSEQGLVATLKGYFGFEYVTILDEIQVSSKKGQATVMADVWNPDVFVYYRPATPSLMTPSFGYSFQLADDVLRTVVRREPIANKGELVEVDWAYQDKVVDADAGFLIKGAVTPA